MTTEVTATAEAPPSEPAPPVAEPPTEQGVGDPNLGQNGSVVDGDPPAVTHDGVVWPGSNLPPLATTSPSPLDSRPPSVGLTTNVGETGIPVAFASSTAGGEFAPSAAEVSEAEQAQSAANSAIRDAATAAAAAAAAAAHVSSAAAWKQHGPGSMPEEQQYEVQQPQYDAAPMYDQSQYDQPQYGEAPHYEQHPQCTPTPARGGGRTHKDRVISAPSVTHAHACPPLSLCRWAL